jgi:hypothetical protein
MMWWFLILGLGVAAIAWAGVSLYVRVHRHMKAPEGASKTSPGEIEVKHEG